MIISPGTRKIKRNLTRFSFLLACIILVECLPLPGEAPTWQKIPFFDAIKRLYAREYATGPMVQQCRQMVYGNPQQPQYPVTGPAVTNDQGAVVAGAPVQPAAPPPQEPAGDQDQPKQPDSTPVQPSPEAASPPKGPDQASDMPKDSSAGPFQLAFSMEGDSFFDQWEFWAQDDPTHGTVAYQDRPSAESDGLAKIENGIATIRVDARQDLPVGQGRPSVRLHSKETFKHGQLLVFDAKQAPYGCGVWPAFWTNGPDPWPGGGEIDIMEGVNNQATNHHALHTSPGCTLATPMQASGTTGILDCDAMLNSNSGCQVIDGNQQSYGEAFNAAGGGVWATLMNDNGISIWFFSRNAIPQDLQNQTPDPSTWGQPTGHFAAEACDPKQFFKDQTIIINITLCGDWAGNTFAADGCPGSCPDHVAKGSNFQNAVWGINYVRVYSPS